MCGGPKLKACFSTPLEVKVHMDGCLDYDFRCTLHCKVHLGLNIDYFLVKLPKLGML